ncbi:hypothetical protein GCM10010448_45610 [Streptomyces glomeratus]|uniref:Uncharacterized protein n=1 Tax=Streptomyces glomeratus TaxID=284452 RepID=A0ABP6LU17_9ACTN
MSLPPKLKLTFVPGCSFSNSWPRAVKLSFREAAANTVIVPDSFGVEDAEDAEESDFSAESEPDPDEEEQALRTSSAAAPAPAV